MPAEKILLRVGRHVPIHLYQQLGPQPCDDDPPAGTMLTADLAAVVVAAVSGQPPPAGPEITRLSALVEKLTGELADANARAEHAEEALSAVRDHNTRWQAAEAQVAALQRELEEAREERDAARLVSQGRTMGQYDALDIYREHRRFHPSPFADCQACRMGVALSHDLPSRPDGPEEIRRLAGESE